MRKILKIIFANSLCINNHICCLWINNTLDIVRLHNNWVSNLNTCRSIRWKSNNDLRSWYVRQCKGVTDKVACDLQEKGQTVTWAGVKSSAASTTIGYNIIVVGGPVYAGALTGSINDALANLVLDQGAKIGVYGSGQGSTSPEDIPQIKQSMPVRSNETLQNAIVVKIGSNEDLNARVQEFVNQLIA